MQLEHRSNRSRSGGFTFAEVLAAMLFLAILVPVIVEGLGLANRAAVTAERQVVAAQLADMRLNELLLNDEWQAAAGQGDFGEEWPGYRWELEEGAWTEDDMTELVIRVVFEVQGREHDVRLVTLVDDSEL
jgi:Tfp pilus assembly protein PilV